MSDLITFAGNHYRRDTSGWYRVYDERAIPIYYVGVLALDEIERLDSVAHMALIGQEELQRALSKTQAEFERLQAQHRHCDHCGGTWLDDGINAGCYCRQSERLKATLTRIAAIEGCECDSYEGHTCVLCRVRAMAREVVE